MASGDFTQVQYMEKALTTTAGDSPISGEAGLRKTITAIMATLQSGAATKRELQVFVGGTAASNLKLRVPLDPAGSYSTLITGLKIVINDGQAAYFKQDVGTDVNVLISGETLEL